MAFVGNEWWGYKHVSGTIHAKRVYYDYQLSIQEAILSPFVKCIVHKFQAESREEALAHIEKELNK
jgi:hypothetical protein